MNCEEINLILDSSAPGALTPQRKLVVEQHFASCCECRAAWAAYCEIAAARTPATPPGLAARVATALAASRPARVRAFRRSAVVGGLLVVGVAAAATIALQVRDGTIEEATDGAPSPVSVTPRPGAAVVVRGDQPANAESSDGGATAAPGVAQYALDRYSLVVLTAPNPATDAQGLGYFEECHAAIVAELRALDGLNVIAAARVAPYAGSSLRPEEIARQLGAGSVLVLSTSDQATVERVVATRAGMGLGTRLGSCLAQQLDAQSGAELMSTGRVAPEWDAAAALSIAADVAERVREALFDSRATQIAAARAKVLNASLEDQQRVAALLELREGAQFSEPLVPSQPDGTSLRSAIPLISLRASVEPMSEAFDEAIVAAVTQIGLTSVSPRARQAAWNNLRAVRDPAVAQALITSLANDRDENVRRAAALALGYLVDEPGVRDELARAAAQDSSEQAPVPCCIPSVRDAARRALRSDAELNAAALITVRDASLSPDDRLRPLYQSVDGRGYPVELDDEAARAVFDIGREAGEPLLRARAWDALRDAQNREFVPTLLADLAESSAENVRGSAAAALRPYVDDPVVRAALEQAQSDPVNAVRRAALAALEGDAR